jgi:hypothetical protein
VDIEFEEVEEGIGYGGNGAVEFGFHTVVEFEGVASFVADWEGDIFELIFFVGDMFASVSIFCISVITKSDLPSSGSSTDLSVHCYRR